MEKDTPALAACPSAMRAPGAPPAPARDIHTATWHWTHNYVAGGYKRLVGPYAWAVYDSLCLHAGADQECYPGLDLLAEECGIARSMVQKCLAILAHHGLIRVGKRTGRLPGRPRNQYTLLHVPPVPNTPPWLLADTPWEAKAKVPPPGTSPTSVRAFEVPPGGKELSSGNKKQKLKQFSPFSASRQRRQPTEEELDAQLARFLAATDAPDAPACPTHGQTCLTDSQGQRRCLACDEPMP